MNARNAFRGAALVVLAATVIGSGRADAEGLRYREQAKGEPAEAARSLRPARPRVQRTDAAAARNGWDGAWLYAYVERLLGGTPSSARRIGAGPRARARDSAPELRPTLASPPDQAGPSRPIKVDPEQADRVGVAAPIGPAVAAASPVVTGALASPTPPATPQVRALDPAQAAADLVKLEFASRVYRETRLPGERVFQLSRDWFVLERAREALNDFDRAAAEAAGFDAAAYINDAQRLVIVAIAGTQDLKRDFFQNDIWQALIRARAPQQFYLTTQYIRSVKRRYVGAGWRVECVGHSLGGGACAYAAAEIGIEGRTINPISAGRIDARAERLVINYVIDGEIAALVFRARGNSLSGMVSVVDDGRDRLARRKMLERWGVLGGVAFVVEGLRDAIADHRVDAALDRIAQQAGLERMR